MRIGILTYHAAMNFGANLQVFSTYYYLKHHGFSPIIINWIASDLEFMYSKSIDSKQIAEHVSFIGDMEMTRKCHTDHDIAEVIIEYGIEGVIIGSDAVVQHHTWRDNISFPSKRIISKIPRTSDTLYPNPFWGNFKKWLSKDFPIVLLSASSQNSDYKNFDRDLKRQMNLSLMNNFRYYSVRDNWTQNMIEYITDGMINPIVTPDPVFAINNNIDEKYVISKQDIQKKYSLKENYVLLSFFNTAGISKHWLSEFESLCESKDFQCVAFPFPSGIKFAHSLRKVIDIPLPILDWYYLIKYASGYVGQNMHPIVVSLHNGVPFYSFDNYGITHFKTFVNSESSKIYHILKTSGFLKNRFEARNFFKNRPKPEYVLHKILNFDKELCMAFSKSYFNAYERNMQNICNIFKNERK